MKMTRLAERALRGSIEKWKKIVAGAGIDGGTFNCPLCKAFIRSLDGCNDCPVAKKTKRNWCYSTPYHKWIAADGHGQTADTPERLAAAKAELKFLRSLLPRKRAKR